MKEINFAELEKKWQDYWRDNQVYKAVENTDKPKYYALTMFPYPSGKGLHVGHPLSYVAADIVARFKKHKGYEVLHPMGFDAFGLPAEQYAIQTGKHPADTTDENIATYKKQLEILGLSYDWDREVRTCDPEYYKWTQWIFLQLFNSWYNKDADKAESIDTLIERFKDQGSRGFEVEQPFTADDWSSFSTEQQEQALQQFRLAYLAYSEVNWCEALGTVLANDEVINGLSERGGHPVTKKKMRQWFLRITDYAERLLQGLENVDWPEPLKEMQRNWIGKSQGAQVKFKVAPKMPPSQPSPAGEGTDALFRTADLKLYESFLKEESRNHRKNPTPAEEALWNNLRREALGVKFRRQHVIDRFIADFICLKEGLIVEVDGEIHQEQKEYDQWRDHILNELGFKVLRFSNQEVLKETDSVLASIQNELAKANSLPHGEGLGMGQTPSNVKGQKGHEHAIEVFTTRPDTIFGSTFMVVAPESDLIQELITEEQREEVEKYIEYVKSRSERDRMADVKTVTGAFTGAYAINPFTNQEIPIWTSEYVLASYGTGAVMAVPAHDSRDYAFAKKFGLEIRQVVSGGDISTESYDAKEGKMMNSGFLDGLDVKDAIAKAIDEIEDLEIGTRKINYRLRDAGFSRQRYWGEPFPIAFKNGVPTALEANALPLTLPEVVSYKPTGTGESPIAAVKDWVKQADGSMRETDTMPGYAGSSWYWLRYMDPTNKQAFVGRDKEAYWQNVDLYIGGSEHAVGHLLYSRLWQKVLFDLDLVGKDEPFQRMVNQGMIQGNSAFIFRVGVQAIGIDDFNGDLPHVFISEELQPDFDAGYLNERIVNEFNAHFSSLYPKVEFSKESTTLLSKATPIHLDIDYVKPNNSIKLEKIRSEESGQLFNALFITSDSSEFKLRREVEKMSKSKLNVVTPDAMVSQYGADTFRMYEMFLGPITDSKPWNTNGIDGVFKFLRKYWNLFHNKEDSFDVSDEKATKEELKVLHACIQRIESDIEKLALNTCVSQFMICVNELQALKCNKREILEPLTVLLSPFAPHIAEEIWEQLGHAPSITLVAYPEFNPEFLVEDEHLYPIMINGKMRHKITLPANISQEDAIAKAMAEEAVQKWTDGKSLRKQIFVPKKIINLVVG